MHRIDGKALAATIRAQVAEDVKKLTHQPTLAVLLVGEEPASQLYVSLKRKAAETVGIRVVVDERPSDVTEQTLLDRIAAWNMDETVDAILVQLPLPNGLDESRIIKAIRPDKDADGFHPENVKTLSGGRFTVITPLHEGIMRLIAQTPLVINAASAVIIANSDVFASPLRRLLQTAGARVETMQPDMLDIATLKKADLIVCAVGRPGFLIPALTKNDAVIIDVGTTRGPDGKVHGDADLKAFEPTDVWITPVPGGVGPMTVAELLNNVVHLATLPTPPAASF